MDVWKYEVYFLVLKRISHSFALMTHEISWSKLHTFSHLCILFSINDII